MIFHEDVPANVAPYARRPSRLERLLFVAVVMLSPSLADRVPEAVAELIWAATYVLSLAGIIIERRFAKELVRKSLPLLVILTLALLSTFWSELPLTTIKRALGLFGTALIAYYVVCRYSLAAFLDIFIIAITADAALSAAMIVFTPELAVDDGGAWKGFFFQKNALAVTMELGVVTILAIISDLRGRKRLVALGSCGLFLLLLIGARSGTAFVALVIVGLAVPTISQLRKLKVSTWLLLIGGIGVSVALFANAFGIGFNEILSAIGRDATFSGRTDVWSIVMEHVGDHPLLGYGYRVFWDPDGPVHGSLLRDIGWEPDSSHSGYLESLINLGFVGLSVFIVFLAQGLQRGARFFYASRDKLSAWPLFVMISAIITNVSETSFLMLNNVIWIIVMIAFLYPSAVSDETRVAEPDFDGPQRPPFLALTSRSGR